MLIKAGRLVLATGNFIEEAMRSVLFSARAPLRPARSGWGVMCALMLSLGLFSAASADVRRIVHPDGRVEFTNVPQSRQNVLASTKRETVYRYQNERGITSFSNERPAGADEVDVIRFDCYACKVSSTVNWHTTRLFLDPYAETIRSAASQFGVDPALVRAVIHAESAFNPRALSPKGAQGLMQLMPATAEELGVSNAMDEAQNIRGGVDYLARMLQLHEGDIRLATAAYNAGPGAVRRYGGIPPFAETRAYVERVAILHDRYQKNGSE